MAHKPNPYGAIIETQKELPSEIPQFTPEQMTKEKFRAGLTMALEEFTKNDDHIRQNAEEIKKLIEAIK